MFFITLLRLADCMSVASNYKIYWLRKARQRLRDKAFNVGQFISLYQGFTGPSGEPGKPVSMCS